MSGTFGSQFAGGRHNKTVRPTSRTAGPRGVSSVMGSEECVIPVKSGTSNMDDVINDTTFKTVESEFVTKYLEKIGVTPSKATVDLMKKLVPINRSTLKTKLKASIAAETEVAVSLKDQGSASLDTQSALSADVISIGALNHLPGEFQSQLEQKRIAKEKASQPFSAETEASGSRNANVFVEASRHHLYPFNLKKKSSSSRMQTHKDVSHQKQSKEEITEHLVLQFQDSFTRGLEEWKKQNTVSLKHSGYLRKKGFQTISQTLQSPTILKLFKVTATYLKEKFIDKSVSFASIRRKETEQGERLYFILHQFLELQRANQKDSLGLCFVLPIILLSLRAFVENCFQSLYPALISTPEGKEILQNMDNYLTALLDPHGWYSKVSIFQSTRSALQIMNSYRKSAHQPVRTFFLTTR